MIDFILYGIELLFVVWLFFINVMTWKKHQAKIPKWVQYVLYIVVAVGWVLDVLFNIIYCSVLFLELPKEWTASERFRRILITKHESSYRWKLAYLFCTKLIEPWDWNHCGLANLK